MGWEKLWLTTQQSNWHSLAIVPAGDMPPDFTLDIAVSLMQIGQQHLETPIRIADATSVALANLSGFMAEFQEVLRAGDRVLLALEPVRINPTTVTLARAADRALLCVPLGMPKVRDTKRTIEEIGEEHFIGSVALHL
jgi:hypothetical protein